MAWEYKVPSDVALHATPLKIGPTLYFCSGHGVTALDAESGARIWRHKVPGSSDKESSCRGLAYHRSAARPGHCNERILTVATIRDPYDVRLVAVDAQDGEHCSTFGENGHVSLLAGLGDIAPGYYYVTSAPTLVQDKVVVGAGIPDFQFWGEPSGVIRAFDAVSGKLAWAWDMGKPENSGEPAAGETYTHSTPNSWAPMSADETLGLVYVPTGNSTPDFYGGHRRRFDERYSSSVVALDAAIGRPRWSFQTTHHDLWDYDVASQPTLVDLSIQGRVVSALIQPTKGGEIFVLDRATGSPIFPVEERKVPQAGGVADDHVAPTQPHSIGLPGFQGSELTEESLWGLTPVDQLWCRIKFREARYEGRYTPPGLTPSIEMPSYFGGINWGGISVDAARGIGIVASNYVPLYVRMLSRDQVNRLGLQRIGSATGSHSPVPLSHRLIINAFDPWNRTVDLGLLFNPAWRWGGPGDGTPYGSLSVAFLSPLQIPCSSPPFGRLSAVDLATGKLIWTQPFGTTRDAGPFGIPSMLPLPLGMATTSGAVVTDSGLTFIGASQEKTLRAYETATGKLLWQQRLPAYGDATPMTYRSAQSGRQFVLIVAGGERVLAYALASGAIGEQTRPQSQVAGH